VDHVAHRFGTGRWLATNGGGYDAYRVVPRAWALTWLAGAHRDAPDAIPAAWREHWAGEAAHYGQAPLPTTFDDLPNAGAPIGAAQAAIEQRASAVGAAVRGWLVPRLLREGRDRGWWDPLAPATLADPATAAGPAALPAVGDPTILAAVDGAAWARLTLAPRVVAPASTAEAHALIAAALGDETRVTAAVQDATVVGLFVTRPTDGGGQDVLALGVAPDWRRRGVATALLAAAGDRPDDDPGRAILTLAERDVVEPLDGRLRLSIGRRLLDRAGYTVEISVP
jgi:ribosomal protein S18 acetylase RimI-like enzyme